MHAGKIVMKQLFLIDNGMPAPGVPVTLSFRTGEKHTSFAITSKEGDKLYLLAYYITPDIWDDIQLEQLYYSHTPLQQSFYEVKVSFDHTPAALLSNAAYRYEEAGNVSAALWGTAAGSVQSEQVAAWQVQNLFTVPADVKHWISQKFPAARTWHQYSVSLHTMGSASPGGTVLVDIRKDDFTMLVVKEGRLLLAQVYTYETPEDVLYCLLRATEELGLSRENCELLLSGLVDQQSSLYKELYLYFISIGFRQNDWNTGEYPSHFFTSLNDLARCG